MMKAFTYLPGIIWCLLTANVKTQPTQVISLSLVTIVWTYFGIALSRPNQKEKQERLIKALEHTGDSGLTEKWYISWHKLCMAAESSMAMMFLMSLILVIRNLYPETFMDTIPLRLEHTWGNFLDSVPNHDFLFADGLFAAHFYPFWGMAKVYAFFDLFKNTKFLKPWKIQSDERLTFRKYMQCIVMALINQWIAFYLLTLIPYNFINPDMFSRTLPSFTTTVLSLGTFAVAAEIWFYSFHRLMHKYDFLYNTFHAQHHSIKAPTSIAAIYANPVEHVLLNFPTLSLGPFICGSHFSLWLLWSFIATVSTCHGHSGWHLPFLSSSESHDFHHSYGSENFGTLGIMDKLFHSQKIWNVSTNKKVDQTYTSPDYPVDKILAREKTITYDNNGLDEYTCNGAQNNA